MSLTIENQKYVRMVFLDASKAFDKVWHRYLIFKLEQLGIVGPLLSWFRSSLSDANSKSCLMAKHQTGQVLMLVSCKVPFWGHYYSFYVNDICFNIISDSNLFADDTSLLSIAYNPYSSKRTEC